MAGVLASAQTQISPVSATPSQGAYNNATGLWTVGTVASGTPQTLRINAVPSAPNLAINNANNVEQYYKDLGEKVQIEIVTFGPGLHMLRADTSPVKERIEAMAGKSKAVFRPAVCAPARMLLP